MSKFGKFDEKETKEGNIRRIISKCLERMIRDHVRTCEDEKTEEVSGILSELLTDKEAKDLLSIANYSKILEKGEEYEDSGLEDKFWRESDENSDWEKFLKSFYYEILPTVLLYKSDFDTVRSDFLRYFILWDNFSEEKKMTIGWIPKDSFEASKRDEIEKLEMLSDIKVLYEYTVSKLQFLRFIEPLDKKYYPTEMIYLEKKISSNLIDDTTFCFYRVFKGLLNNIDFFKAIIKEKLLTPEVVLYIFNFNRDYLFETFKIPTKCSEENFILATNEKDLETLREENKDTGFGSIVCESEEEIKALTEPKKGFEDEIFHYEVKKEYAEIFFSWDEMTDFLAEDDPSKNSGIYFINRSFFSLMQKLNPEYEIPIIRRVAEREVKKIFVGDINYDIDFFSCHADVLVNSCRRHCGKEAIEQREVKLFLLGLFLREKLLYHEHFKKMPELFQQLAIVEQMRSVFKKAEIAVVPDLPETDIDKDKLKKDVDKFMSELKKIARNGGKPSDYYAGEFTEKVQGVADSASWLTSIVFDVAVSFLKDSFGTWKAVKPMLAIFRNLREQAYSIDMEHYDYERYIWAFVPLRITPLLGSLEGEDAADICEEWFKHLAGELKSADDFAVNKRKENPENVPEEFRTGYDIKIIEPHPLWREAYCEAAGDLRVSLGCKSVFNHLKKNDIDKDVREAAAKTLERIEKIKGKFDSGSRKRALLNAWWWYRVAHLKSLGIDFDWVAAQNLKSREVKINYPKDY